MAQQFVDGFDNYTTLSDIWESGTGTIQNTSPSTRFTNPSGAVSSYVALSVAARKNFTNSQTVICGFAVRFTQLPSGTRDIVNLQDNGTIQTSLTFNSAGALQFYRGGAAGTPIGTQTATATVAVNTWYSFAIVVTIAGGTSGSVSVYMNGSATPLFTSTGLNTQSSSNAFCNQFLINTNTGGTMYFDDVYIFDNTGSSQNAYPGNDQRVITKMPTSAGFYTNWTANGLGTNWQNNAVIPRNASDFVSNNTPGTRDSYTLTVVGLTVAPTSVTTRQSVYKDDANVHTAQALMRSSGVDAVGSAFSVPSSQAYFDTQFENDPNTSAPWTGAAADAAQIGVVETS